MRRERATRSDDILLPPRNVPDVGESPVREDHRADARSEERVIERRVLRDDEEVVIVRKRRSATADEPWYREPQRWIEGLNPF